jgi:anhydro-N-acetylmuramic acid kinase
MIFSKNLFQKLQVELFSKAYVYRSQEVSDTLHIPSHDLLATLTRFSAETIAEAVHSLNLSNLSDFTVYTSGGGMHNPLLMEWLQELIPAKFAKTNELGINGDAKEAVLFAILANETVAGGESDFGTRRGIPSVTMGKFLFLLKYARIIFGRCNLWFEVCI